MFVAASKPIAPVEPITNPITELRRKCHEIVQTLSEGELLRMIECSPENRERRKQQLRDRWTEQPTKAIDACDHCHNSINRCRQCTNL